MSPFQNFVPVAPLGPQVIQSHEDRVPIPIAEVWRDHGVGHTAGGFVRVLDPVHAERMLAGVYLPPGAVPVFSTGLGDIVFFWQNLFLAAKFRWGVIDPLGSAEQAADLLSQLEHGPFLDRFLQREPYPTAAARDGVPGPDQCYGFVPLLALGGPSTADHLELCGMWEHHAVIVQMAGVPQVRR